MCFRCRIRGFSGAVLMFGRLFGSCDTCVICLLMTSAFGGCLDLFLFAILKSEGCIIDTEPRAREENALRENENNLIHQEH